MILQTLYQQCIKNEVNFFDEFHVVDLITNNGAVCGVVALELGTGEIHVFHSKAIMFATGGWGRVWSVTSNAHSLTGDGAAVVYRRGIPLQDMEFFQFHPTGIYKMGILITEGVRGEGGVLINGRGERFMERYAPNIKDLASRDVVSRAIYLEIRDGNGIKGKDYVYLDVTPETVNRYLAEAGETRRIDANYVEQKLPDILDFCRVYLGVDPVKEPMPIQPTAHYAMGGIPTNVDAEVVIDENWTVLPGLYAAGETACVSVHGANRLGTNSLVDLIVFGRRGGMAMAEYVKHADYTPLPANPDRRSRSRIQPHPQQQRQNAPRRTARDHAEDHDGGRQRFPRGKADDRSPQHPARPARTLPERPADRRPGAQVQYRRARSVGTRLYARPRRNHDHQRAQPHRESRRSQPRGLQGTRRRELAGPYAGLASGGWARIRKATCTRRSTPRRRSTCRWRKKTSASCRKSGLTKRSTETGGTEYGMT